MNTKELEEKIEYLERANKLLTDQLIKVIMDYQDQIEQLRAAQKELIAKEVMEQELHIAAEIQNALLPKKLPKIMNIELFGRMIPAKEVGGDYYDIIFDNNTGVLNISIGDASGKSVPASLISVMARNLVRPLLTMSKSTCDILLEVNRWLYHDVESHNRFITMLLFRWDEHNPDVFHYTTAGHNCPIFYSAEKHRSIELPSRGLAIGVLDDIKEFISEEEVKWQVGDVVILYTDGITEARNEKGKMLYVNGLMEFVDQIGNRSAKDIGENILKRLFEFTGDKEQFDDITLVVIKRIC